ncbi:MAG: hypothetical protein IMZ53_09650 [Thermoplasmata archaeon]|nr:hypothetical protein [Thermoplasmata archaeon]
MSLQVAQIFALADPQSVGRILNLPSIFPVFVLFIPVEVGSERAWHKPGFRYHHHLPADGFSPVGRLPAPTPRPGRFVLAERSGRARRDRCSQGDVTAPLRPNPSTPGQRQPE